MTEIERLQENANQINADFQAVKSAIVESGVEVPEGTRTQEYGAKVRKVYDNGKQAQYDAFWDAYLSNGTRYAFNTAFGGEGWTNNTFKPKYDITPHYAYMTFRATGISGDLVEILNECGVSLDFSESTMCYYIFSEATKITRLGVMDFSSVSSTTGAEYAFYYCRALETIDEIILPNKRLNLGNAFGGCIALKNVKFGGGAIQYNISFADCPLTRASIESVMNALSTDASGYAVTFSRAAVNTAFETSTGAADGSNSAEWEALKATRNTWTISLSPT